MGLRSVSGEEPKFRPQSPTGYFTALQAFMAISLSMEPCAGELSSAKS